MSQHLALALVALAGVLAAPPAAAAIATVESGVSTIRIAGAPVVESSDAKTDGRVSVYAISGTPTTPEVRTAARASPEGEMAANVRIDDKSRYSFTRLDEAISAATLEIQVGADNALVRRAALDFMLPPSYMEVTSNAELPQNALSMVLLANLEVCFATLCGSADTRFAFQAEMEGAWQSFTHFESAHADAGVDVAPLLAPTITDSGTAAFERTTTIEFAAFHGHLDLGIVPAGAPLTVSYQMQARGAGRMVANIGLAAINDPFLLETDPVQPGFGMALALAPVPEPGPAALLAAGLAALAGWRRRRR